MAAPKLTLYHVAPSPPARTVRLLAHALGLELDLKNVNLLGGEQLKEEFVKVNPQHTVPCLQDGDFIVAESFAIMVYLIETYAKDSKLYPSDTKKKAIVHQRILFVNGTLFPRWSLGYVFPKVYLKTEAYKPIVERFQDGLKVTDNYLKQHKWFAGDELTIADFSLFSLLSSVEESSSDFNKHQNIVDWMKRFREQIVGTEEIDSPGAKALGDLLANVK